MPGGFTQHRGAVSDYLIESPAVINFSGGRSSGFMLWNILQAYDGKLPEDIKVIFCNTGLEHHQTYEFIHRIEMNWCAVVWLEYTLTPEGKASYAEVSYETASRRGEPFTKLIGKNTHGRGKKFLPNPVARICTVAMKITTVKKYMGDTVDWMSCIGLRSDEQRRVSRLRSRINPPLMPMADAGHSNQDVRAFWNGHPLDLQLPLDSNIFGNCVGCFLKGYGKLEAIAREEPWQLDWWIRQEQESGATFVKNRPDYKTIKQDAHKQRAFDFGDTIDCFCTD